MRRIKRFGIIIIALGLILAGLKFWGVISPFSKISSEKKTAELNPSSKIGSSDDNWDGSAGENSDDIEGIEYGAAEICDENNTDQPEWLQKMISLNPEVTDYAQDYPKRDSYINKPVDISDECEAGKVPFLLQWDKRWGYDPYGEETIGAAGCGPTCLSMAYIYLTGDSSGNPREMAHFTYENGFYTEDGTSWYLWTDGVNELGLDGKEIPFDESSMESALDNGSIIICSMRPGDFTTTGHYILIRGYDENGFFVNDPNHVSTSEKQWTFDELDGQVKNLWSIANQ